MEEEIHGRYEINQVKILKLEYVVSKVKIHWLDLSTDWILHSNKTVPTEAQKEENTEQGSGHGKNIASVTCGMISHNQST